MNNANRPSEYTEVPTRAEFDELAKHVQEHCAFFNMTDHNIKAVVKELASVNGELESFINHYTMATVLSNMQNAVFAALLRHVAEKDKVELDELNLELLEKALEIVKQPTKDDGSEMAKRLKETNSFTITALEEKLKGMRESKNEP